MTSMVKQARECLMDVVSHHNDFVGACEHKKATAGCDGDALYWQHQIDVLVRMKKQAEAALKAGAFAAFVEEDFSKLEVR